MYNILSNLWDKLIFPLFNGFMSMAQVGDEFWNSIITTMFSLFEALADGFKLIVSLVDGIMKFFGA